jgi:nucleoside-diphosphate-sugar epimerase
MMILKILILGGTTFLGPHLVEVLLQKGHEITLFNRGSHAPPPHVESLMGDRDGNLAALKNRHWDAVIDTSGHLPRLVEASSKLISTNHYTFISTIGAYCDFHALNIDESYPLAKEVDTEEINEKTYGALKASCEKVIARYFPHSLIIRPGLIVGPGDPTKRFSYWPFRLLEGGEVLAPGSPNLKVQFIDVRDLAEWIAAMVEKQATGVYNATGPVITFEQLLRTCQKEASLIWVDEDFLIEHGVQDWVELPLWLSYKRKMPGFFSINAEKAGLTIRPLNETISAILATDEQRGGLTPAREKALLKLWRKI